MHTCTSPRLFATAILIAGSLFLTGCSTSKPANAKNKTDIVQVISFWQPQLLYVLAAPHPRLYVEVDAVEGCAPSEAALDKLRNFLTTYCNKPDGIEIVRSDVIPVKTAQGISSPTLMRRFLDGPPTNSSASSPAFMYILYYDGKLCDQSPAAEPAQKNPPPKPRDPERNKNPHVDFLPYPAAIYLNTRYGPKVISDEMPLHEAGHLLGLAARPEGASNYHCLDTTCRMNWTVRVHISRLLTGRDPVKQRQLCPRCIAQLAHSAKQSPPANLHFVGPVLVRSEAGYHVLSLPSRVKLIVGDLTDEDCRNFTNSLRNETPLPNVNSDDVRWDAFAKAALLANPAKARDILNRAQADPFEPVRLAATKLEQTIKTE